MKPTSTIVCQDIVICLEPLEDADAPEDLLRRVETALVGIGESYQQGFDKFGLPIIELKVPYTTKIKKWRGILQEQIGTDVMIDIIDLYANCDFTLEVQLYDKPPN